MGIPRDFYVFVLFHTYFLGLNELPGQNHRKEMLLQITDCSSLLNFRNWHFTAKITDSIGICHGIYSYQYVTRSSANTVSYGL